MGTLYAKNTPKKEIKYVSGQNQPCLQLVCCERLVGRAGGLRAYVSLYIVEVSSMSNDRRKR